MSGRAQILKAQHSSNVQDESHLVVAAGDAGEVLFTHCSHCFRSWTNVLAMKRDNAVNSIHDDSEANLRIKVQYDDRRLWTIRNLREVQLQAQIEHGDHLAAKIDDAFEV